ncbi:MAG TPA: thioredoxin, partial [Nitrosopumilaceae archaeon]|nr:thioredoxin [Nitrosopumilaceae archaeon]
RSKRIAPGRDDKILTSWNGLMISAFAKGYRISGLNEFLDATQNCITFIEEKLTKNGKLLRTYKNGQAKLMAYLDDYVYFVNALLDVFEINPDAKYLDLAVKHADYLIDHFWDESENNFFFTADDHEKLIIRTKNLYDLSLPSGNSVAAYAFLKLYHLTQDKKFLDVSTKIMESLAIMAAENPFGFGQLLNAMYLYLKKPIEITLLNTKDHEIYYALVKKFLPESIFVTIRNKEQLTKLANYQFFAGKQFDKNKTIVFVCKDFTCSLPLDNLSEIEKLI